MAINPSAAHGPFAPQPSGHQQHRRPARSARPARLHHAILLALSSLAMGAAAPLIAQDSHTPEAKDTNTPALRGHTTFLPQVDVKDWQQQPHGTLQMSIDPRLAAQQRPMTDGASLLKEIPNMGVVRKGQQAGDPVFRGLGGSRLAITASDQFLYGGCGIRMDTPTSYINPASYDELKVIKGPQTVLQGPGLVAGSVEFVRHPRTYGKPTLDAEAALSVGSFGQHDALADLSVGHPLASLRAILTHSHADDYKDGAGQRVRSWYKRRSASLNLGITPTQDIRGDIFVDTNRSQAKFASLQLDAGKTDRDSWGGKFEYRNINPWLRKLAMQAGRSHQEIIMGRQFRGRQAGGNPDRITYDGKLSADLAWTGAQRATVGLDWFADKHRARRAYTDMPRSLSEKSRNLGVFVENTSPLDDSHAIVAGVRHDRMRANTYTGFWNDGPPEWNRYSLTAGFARFESRQQTVQYHAGLGYTERAPDFWERNRNRSVKAEHSLQLDVGASTAVAGVQLHGSFFANRIDDYILIKKDDPTLNDLAANSTARNIDATRYGFELGAERVWSGRWKLTADLSYTWGRNDTERRPLGQIPPLEGKLRFGHDTPEWGLAGTMRVASHQHRVAVGQGNVNGVDIGTTPGFAVFGVQGHWRASSMLRLAFGIDNLFDRLYAEHLTKAVQTPEFYQALGLNPNAGSTTRINEPGRTVWVRAEFRW